MKIIIDGEYNRDLIAHIKNDKLPITHIIVHVPQSSIGNSSIFLPKNLPSFSEFEEYTRLIQENGIIPIAGLDSTCQGNLEAHIQQYEANNSLFKKLNSLDYKEILVSSPNNVGYVKANYPSMKIYLSYSQYVTSINRAKIFFKLGINSIILHPDIIRFFHALESFIKFKEISHQSHKIDYILPLNLGCNWGCIHWYQHHNLQSHRTINSPVLSDQEQISNVDDEFDYSLLYCWKKRLKEPVNILKSGWISPENVDFYKNMGYQNFLLFTSGFSTNKIIKLIKSYIDKSLEEPFNEYLNIPQPYGSYWPKNGTKQALIQLSPDNLSRFVRHYPYHNYYPFENEMNEYCENYLQYFKVGNVQEREKLLETINKKMNEMRKGTLKG